MESLLELAAAQPTRALAPGEILIAQGREGKLWAWINGLLARRSFNTTVAAVANKLARIVWAMLSRRAAYQAA